MTTVSAAKLQLLTFTDPAVQRLVGHFDALYKVQEIIIKYPSLLLDRSVISSFIGLADNLAFSSRKTIFGADELSVWGDVGQIPPPPKELLMDLVKPCPFDGEKKMSETHIVIFKPSQIDGRYLTPELLDEISQSEKFGMYKTRYNSIYSRVAHHTDATLSGYWLAIPRRIPPQTLGQSYQNQIVFLQSCPGYEVPTIIDIMFSCLTAHVSSEGRSSLQLGRYPWRFTKCKEEIEGDHLAVGGLSWNGMQIYPYSDYLDIGLLPVKKYLLDYNHQIT